MSLEKKKKKEKWENRFMGFEQTGFKYGYPKCCIETFVRRLAKRTPLENKKAGNCSGFIPCDNCTKNIYTSYNPEISSWGDHVRTELLKLIGRDLFSNKIPVFNYKVSKREQDRFTKQHTILG